MTSSSQVKSNCKKILGPSMDQNVEYKFQTHAQCPSFSISGTKKNHFRYPLNQEEFFEFQQRYLVIQIFKKISDTVKITLFIRNNQNEIQKFVFSSLLKGKGGSISSSVSSPPSRSASSRPQTSTTKTSIPISIPSDGWANICFDLEYVVNEYWSRNSFHSLAAIEITPTCLIFNIFTMDTPLKAENDGNDIPNKLKFWPGIKSRTFLFHDKPKSARRPSKIPQRLHNVQSALSNRPSNSLVAPKSQKDIYDDSIEDDFEDSDSQPEDINNQNNILSDDDEEDTQLTLVYIEPLGCYYCPTDQKYYEITE